MADSAAGLRTRMNYGDGYQGNLLFHDAQTVGWDQHGGSRAQAHHSSIFLVGLRSLRELVPPYNVQA